MSLTKSQSLTSEPITKADLERSNKVLIAENNSLTTEVKQLKARVKNYKANESELKKRNAQTMINVEQILDNIVSDPKSTPEQIEWAMSKLKILNE